MTLWDAAIQGDVEALNAALDASPETLNQIGADGWTALHLAAHFGRIECVRVLIQRGADVSIRSANPMGNLALHAAAAGRVPALRPQVLSLLIDAGTPVDATQRGGYTALHSACANADTVSMELLIARGANLHHAAEDGRTPASLTGRAAGAS